MRQLAPDESLRFSLSPTVWGERIGIITKIIEDVGIKMGHQDKMPISEYH